MNARLSKHFTALWLGLILSLLAFPLAATNSDIGKERRWADQVIDGLLDGDELWLQDGSGHEFLGIYTPAEDNAETAVVLIHGIGVHPNWPDVIYPLREGLLEQGTTTLSLQMPVLANDADAKDYLLLFEESPARIKAGISYLREQGFSRITLVAHSMGAAMATHYLASPEALDVESLVIIGMSPGLTGNSNISALERIEVPVLDLYGSEDLEAVLEFAGQRALAGQVGSDRSYSQVRVDGANHFFQGHESTLVGRVIDWLEAK